MPTAAATSTGFRWQDFVPDLIAGPATTQGTTGATSGTGQTQEAGATTDSRSYTGGFEQLAAGVAGAGSTLLGQTMGPNGVPQVPASYQQAVDQVAGISTNGTAGAQGYADKLGAMTQTSNAPWMASLGNVDVTNKGALDAFKGTDVSGMTAGLKDVNVRDVGTSTWSKGAYDQYANPYTSAVYDTQMAALTKSQAEEQAAMSAKLAKAKSFGSRGQIASGQLAADQASLKSETGSKLLSDGYDKAFAAFTSDAGRSLDASKSNQAADISKAGLQQSGAKIGIDAAQTGDQIRLDALKSSTANDLDRERIESGNAATAIGANQTADKMKQEQLQNSVANELSIANSRMSASELLATLSQGQFELAAKQSGLSLERLTAIAALLNVGTTTSVKTNQSTTNTASNEQSKTNLVKQTQQEGLSDAEKEELENGTGTTPGGGTTTPGGGTTTPGGTTGGNGGTLPGYEQPFPIPTRPGTVPEGATYKPPAAGSPAGTTGTWTDPKTGNVFNDSGTKVTNGNGPTTPGGITPPTTAPTVRPPGLPPGATYDPAKGGYVDPTDPTKGWDVNGKPYVIDPTTGVWKPQAGTTTPGTTTPGTTPPGSTPPGYPIGVPPGAVHDPATGTWKDPTGQVWQQTPTGTWVKKPAGATNPTTGSPIVPTYPNGPSLTMGQGQWSMSVPQDYYTNTTKGVIGTNVSTGNEQSIDVNRFGNYLANVTNSLNTIGSTPYQTEGYKKTSQGGMQTFTWPGKDGGTAVSAVLYDNGGNVRIQPSSNLLFLDHEYTHNGYYTWDAANGTALYNLSGQLGGDVIALDPGDPMTQFLAAAVTQMTESKNTTSVPVPTPRPAYADGGVVDPLAEIASSYQNGGLVGYASGGVVGAGAGFGSFSSPLDDGYLGRVDAFRRRPTKKSDLATMDLNLAIASPATRIDPDAALEKGMGTYVNRVTNDGAALLEVPDEIAKPKAAPDFTKSDELFGQSQEFLDGSADTVKDLGAIDLADFAFDPLATTRLGEGTGDERYDALMFQLASKENSPFAAIGKGYAARQARDLGLATKRFDAGKDVAGFEADKLKSIASAEAGLAGKSAELAGADVQRQLDQGSYQARLDALLLEPEAKRAQIAASNATASGAGKGGLQTVWGKDANGNTVALQQTPDGKLRALEVPEGVDPLSLSEQASERAAGKATGTAQANAVIDAPKSIVQADTMIGQIDKVLEDPNLGWATGMWGGILGSIPGTQTRGTVARMAQLEGQAFLQAFESLRGGGAITEIEGMKATQAIAALDRAQSENDYRRALAELKEVVISARGRAQIKLQGGSGAEALAGSPPPGTVPAAAAPAGTPSGGATSSGLKWKVKG